MKKPAKKVIKKPIKPAKPKVIQLKKAEYTELSYEYPSGCFFGIQSDGTVFNAYSCRESIFRHTLTSHNDRRLGFKCDPKPDIKVARAFFKILEDWLSLKERTVITPGSYRNTLVFEFPAFWSETELRRQMLTLFMRCGVCYFRGDFRDAMNRYNLINAIQPAVDRFLLGYTRLNPKFKFDLSMSYGAVGMFNRKTAGQVETMLVKPC